MINNYGSKFPDWGGSMDNSVAVMLEHQHGFFSVESPWCYKVVPQFGIAELVQITPIATVYRTYMEQTAIWFINQ